jgi:chemotaxis regulatin CheY-phosphate phosphatase CheZ
MKHEELQAIQEKVDELQAVLVFGKRAMPFLEDIFAFVKEIIPVIEELKDSVDATSEKLPTASKQLDKVTHATELASTEILNTLEAMFATLEGMTSHHHQQQVRLKEIESTTQAVKEALDMLGSRPIAVNTLDELRKAWNIHMTVLNTPIPDGGVKTLQRLQNDCTNIMMALQVQDITSQQIAAVNRLMQSVDDGLNRLMQHFSEVPAKFEPQRYSQPRLDIKFDADAEYVGAEERQKVADDLVARMHLDGENGKNGND